MENFKKVVCVGTTEEHRMRAGKFDARIFAKIEHTDGKLSISGVIGPLSNGDALGSCGQFIMSFKEYDRRGHKTLADIKPGAGWNAETIKRFFDTWNRWHLNDMRAGCEHQRAQWDPGEQVEVVRYKLTSAAYRTRRDALAKAAAAGLKGRLLELTSTERALAEIEHWYADIYEAPDADSPLSGCYEVSKREVKSVGWVSPQEHPRGILGKPCPVCGYKYGTKWLREDVPADVLEFLRALPDSPVAPAWV